MDPATVTVCRLDFGPLAVPELLQERRAIAESKRQTAKNLFIRRLRLARRFEVPYYFSFHHEYHQFGNIYGMVGYPLQVF